MVIILPLTFTSLNINKYVIGYASFTLTTKKSFLWGGGTRQTSRLHYKHSQKQCNFCTSVQGTFLDSPLILWKNAFQTILQNWRAGLKQQMALYKPLPSIQEYLDHPDPDYVKNQFLFLVNAASSQTFKVGGGSTKPLPSKYGPGHVCIYIYT